MGADRLIFHTGGQGGHLRKNRFCVARKVIDQLLPIAEEHGVVLALEPLSFGPDAWLTIGGQRLSLAGGAVEGMGGEIDNVRIWSRALSDAEVGELLTLSADGDRDGLPDHSEVALGTDRLSGDSDGDGLGDAYELVIGTDPLVPDAPATSSATGLEVYTPPQTYSP